MSLAHLLSHRVNVHRLGADSADAKGNRTAKFAIVATDEKARVQHHNSWEDKEGRTVNIQNWRIYMEPTIDITVSDRIEWPQTGQIFDVLVVEPVGAPGRDPHHKYAFLQEVL